jgi:ABC-2 type transport system ATP-binding protein
MSIKILNISKNYVSQKALDKVSFEIKKGEIVGFLGPNGAGKSTLMKIITGYILPSEGRVTINDISVAEQPLLIQQKIGYLPENNPLYYEMYVKEYLGFVAEIHKVKKEEVQKVIEKVGLLPEAHKKIEELSKGYKQRVGLAAALIHDPQVLILDEPTTGLDPNQLIGIRNLIKEIGKEKIILFSTHILQEVEAVCDRVIVLKKGRIVADEKIQTLREQQSQVIEVAFDSQIEERFFKELPNLDKLKNVGVADWEITFSTKEDMRAAIFDFANTNGLKIIQMNTKNKNLESLFRELTL